jgi:hypothetical protein
MKRMRCYYIPFLNSSTVLKLAHASAQSFSRTSRNSYSDVLTKIMHARRLRVMDGTLPFPTPTRERHRIDMSLARSALSADREHRPRERGPPHHFTLVLVVVTSPIKSWRSDRMILCHEVPLQSLQSKMSGKIGLMDGRQIRRGAFLEAKVPLSQAN